MLYSNKSSMSARVKHKCRTHSTLSMCSPKRFHPISIKCSKHQNNSEYMHLLNTIEMEHVWYIYFMFEKTAVTLNQECATITRTKLTLQELLCTYIETDYRTGVTNLNTRMNITHRHIYTYIHNNGLLTSNARANGICETGAIFLWNVWMLRRVIIIWLYIFFIAIILTRWMPLKR